MEIKGGGWLGVGRGRS